MIVRFGCVVEGHGEREAVPILLRRIAGEIDDTVQVIVNHPVRVPKSRLVTPGGIEKAVQQAAIGLSPAAAILVILDSDDDCPERLGPELLARSIAARRDVPLALVLAKHEFEAWFLAAAVSLRNHRGLPPDLECPADPEGLRGAKEWLRTRMGGAGYSEVLDQPALAAQLDLASARSAPSFDKCYREVARLIAEVSRRQAAAE